MNYFSDNQKDIGITVIGGLTGHGDMTQAELDQKIEDIKELLHAKKPLIIDELREKHPTFRVGNNNI